MNPVKLRLSAFVYFLLASFALLADPIDSLRALQTAQNFYATRQPDLSAMQKANLTFRLSQKRPLQNPTTEKSGAEEFLYYVFNVGNNNGFVIVSADDAAHPILGYSTTGYFETENQPSHVASWMQTYASQLQEIKDKRLKTTPEITREWQEIREGLLPAINKAAVVGPLITTKWGQGSPNQPTYNALCPLLNNKPTITGCVATAMAQLMRFHRHPQSSAVIPGYRPGRLPYSIPDITDTSLDWNNMPPTISTTSNSLSINAVAKLMRNCGVSVKMNYGLGYPSDEGSGAWPAVMASALSTYFGYDNGIQFVSRNDGRYTETQWLSVIRSELNQNRPIYFGGTDASRFSRGGHAFICDGYEDTGKLLFNFGWDGAWDGAYYINAINPGTDSWTLSQEIIIGIKPRLTPDYKITLLNSLSVTWANGNIDAKLFVTNSGSAPFNGDLALAIYDIDGTFYDFIETKTGVTIARNDITNGKATFQKSNFVYSEGVYQVYALYRETGQSEWQLISKGLAQNPILISSIAPAGSIRLASNIVPNRKPLEKGNSLSVNANIINKGASTFSGQIQVDLFKLDGTYYKTVASLVGSPLPVNSKYSNDLTFTNIKLDAEPGTYLLTLWVRPTNGAWQLVSEEGAFKNSVKVFVVDPPKPDNYEPNDLTDGTYAVSLDNNSPQHFETQDANFHRDGDFDCYSLALNPNTSYLISSQLHDRERSTKGTFTVSANYLYLLDFLGSGTSFTSNTFNSRNPASFTTTNSSDATFCVTSAWLGTIGTYLFEMDVQSVPKVAVTPKTSLTQCNAPVVLEAPSGYGFYRWYRDGGFMTEITSTTYAAIFTGNYTVEAGITTVNGRLVGPRSNGISVIPFVSTTAPIASSVSYYQNDVANPLTATGQNLRWYYSATSTQSYTSITPSTSATGTQTYYVTQTISGCESTRTEVVVSVIPSFGCIVMATRKDGLWTDPTVWSCGRVPLSTELVYVRHTVSIPSNQIARARRIFLGVGGKITSESLGRLQLGQ